ncbi:hypothetical protein IDSA_10085 [Pseudidiomarina salinarum]|uniref:Uncharacterized protein n=1 Tax=Pseudidiomarina salinarum TaxID=435908 RepID=A0A094JCX5_9GAMM|nr:hypothetical protein [Pseudidiomarina salinarum]KFZ30406.1 hypothetical protein IDSA_10085 [Pseudidiomarina salinarum]RUO68554.1 hypothetical protein CWI79_10785 [Pseudidiomarina salinarum]
MISLVALKALVIWAGILLLAIINGVLRESVLMPALGTPAALILSGLLLCALIIGVAYFSLPWLQIQRPVELGWLALTLAFEFSFGLWQGKSWPELLEAYTFTGGNIWLIVLAVTALAPYIAAKLRGWA